MPPRADTTALRVAIVTLLGLGMLCIGLVIEVVQLRTDLATERLERANDVKAATLTLGGNDEVDPVRLRDLAERLRRCTLALAACVRRTPAGPGASTVAWEPCQRTPDPGRQP